MTRPDEQFQSDRSSTSPAGSSPIPEVIEAVQRLAGALVTPERLRRAHQVMKEKRIKERMLPFFQQMAELCSLTDPLGCGASVKEDAAAYQKLVKHAENLWEDACLLFQAERYAPSLFFAIVTLEETGKIAVARLQLLFRDQRRLTGEPKELEVLRRRDNPLYSHTQKHLLAACAGAVVNSRLDRLFGIENVNSFLSDVEACKVEKLRQNCLYAELQGRTLHLPYESVTKNDASFYLVLAGELLAEVAPLAGLDFQHFLGKVEELERKIGLVP